MLYLICMLAVCAGVVAQLACGRAPLPLPALPKLPDPPGRCLTRPPPIIQPEDFEGVGPPDCPTSAVCLTSKSAVALVTWVSAMRAWQLEAWVKCGPKFEIPTDGQEVR